MASGGFSRNAPPNSVQVCKSPCARSQEADDEIAAAAAARIEKFTGEKVSATGMLPTDNEPYKAEGTWNGKSMCQQSAESLGPRLRRFNRYREALPYANATQDLNELGDAADSKKAASKRQVKCLTMLPEDAAELNAALGLPPNTIQQSDLRNDKTGFRAAIYRSEQTGKLILVARDTQPNSLEDWKTNTDNGQGIDTKQYQAMRSLTSSLYLKGVSFDIAGYSKGGGLAQEAGLIAEESKVFVFNSAGLHQASVQRMGNSSFDDLEARTKSFSSAGEFLTYMNETTDPAQQLRNARFLRTELAGQGAGINPINIKYRNPETKQQKDAAGWFADDPDNEFEADKQNYLRSLDEMIARADPTKEAIFPPVRAGSKETVRNSAGGPFTGPDSQGWFTGPENGPNLARLAQHRISTVTEGLDTTIEQDRRELTDFMQTCG